MYRCLRGDIVEGQNLVVLVDDLGRDFPVDDLGKQSIHYGCSMRVIGLECTQARRLRPALYN